MFPGSGSGVYGAPSGSGVFGAPPDNTPSGGFGGQPGGSPSLSSSGFGASPGQGSGAFGAGPSGAFGAGPSGAFGAGPSGAFGADSKPSAGSAGEALELNLEQLGLTGERYHLEHRPAPGYWEARDRHLERRVVLRVAEAGEAPDANFWRHARVLALLDQPSVRDVHDLGVLPGRGSFYCLGPIEGVSLEELISSEERPPLPALLRALIAVCASLQHAHERDLVHARLNPSLVRLGGHGQVYVAGWENAAFLPSAEESLRRRLGPPAPIDPSELNALAPELRQPNARLSARTDVHALGRLLHWILSGRLPKAGEDPELHLRRAGAPRELTAVAGKALSEVERNRYAGARHFADDLRRFLDGKAVLAERDPPLRAALRLARRYPLAAGVGALVSAVVLCGALVTYQAVRARADRAQYAQGQADLAAGEAETRRMQAEAQLALARERADAGKLVRSFEVALERARGGGRKGLIAYGEAQRIVDQLEERRDAEGSQLARSFRLRLLLARGRDRLYSLDDPRPSQALDDFEAFAKLAPSDPRGHFMVYEAARRLPGREAAKRENQALEDLREIGGTWGELAGVGSELREIEARAVDLAKRRTPQVLVRTDAINRLEQRLKLLSGQLGDVSQARTWRGRLGIALTGPGLYRQQPVMRGTERTKAGSDGVLKGIWTHLFWAILLDPTDPEPRVAYTTSFFAKWGAHSLSRHKGGWPLGSLAVICRRAERADTSLALADLLVSQGRAESTLPLVERALALPDPQPPRDSSVRPRLELILARARLKRGLAQPTRLTGLSLPAGYEAQVDALKAWTSFVEGDLNSGFAAVRKVLDRLREGVRSRLDFQAIYDLAFALADERPRAEGMIAGLERLVGPPPRGHRMRQIEAALRYGLMMQASRVPTQRAADRGFQELACYRANFQGTFGRGLNSGTWWHARRLAEVRLMTHFDPADPRGQLVGVTTLGQLCLGEDSSEALLEPLRDALVNRLRQIGNERAAKAFSEIDDPFNELLPARVYTAPEVWDWKGRERGVR